MKQLLAQLQHFSDEFKGTSLAVAELGEKLEMRVRDLGELTTFVDVNQMAMTKLHDDLKKKVLHVQQQVESRVMNLEQWGSDLAQSFNIVEGRVTNLEQWGVRSSLRAYECEPPALGGT